MINALQGKPLIDSSGSITVMVNGVGYEVYIPPSLKEKIRDKKEIFLFVHTHVRDDLLELYGFAKKEELNLFRLLLQVSGVGPKTALSIVDLGLEEVQKAVVNADTSFFTLIPRLGKKNAQKIIIELKPKLGDLEELDLSGERESETGELIEALKTMGFSSKEAYKSVRKLPKKLKIVEDKIRYALKNLAHS